MGNCKADVQLSWKKVAENNHMYHETVLKHNRHTDGESKLYTGYSLVQRFIKYVKTAD